MSEQRSPNRPPPLGFRTPIYYGFLFMFSCFTLFMVGVVVFSVSKEASVAVVEGVLGAAFGIYMFRLFVKGKRRWDRGEVILPQRRRKE